MPTYWIKVGHTGYHIEANDTKGARILALDKYREQYPLRAKIRDPAKSYHIRETDINPIAVTEARIVRYHE